MTSPTSHHPHLTLEQLSSLVDERLEPGEQSSVEEHLAACEVCQAELASLEATVERLRQLPEIEPPRSFLLSEDATPRELRPGPGDRGGLPALARRLAPWTRAAGALAAAVFVVLVSIDLLGLGRAAVPAAAPGPAAQEAARPAAKPATAAKPAAVAPPAAAGSQPLNEKSAKTAPAAPDTAARSAPQPGGAMDRGFAPLATPALPAGSGPAQPATAPAEVVGREPSRDGLIAGSSIRAWQAAAGLAAALLLSVSVILTRLARRPGRG